MRGWSPGTSLITGASSGIGRSLALRLARDGWRVGVLARRGEALSALCREVEAGGGVAMAFPADVSDQAGVREAAEACAAALGPVDLLVTNAGMSVRTPGLALRADDVEAIMRVNYLGAVYAVEAVLPGMLDRRRGWILGVSSLTAYRGLPLTAGYSASKAALSNFLESLRLDLKGSGVGVTTAHLGYVRTPMTAGASHAQPFIIEADVAVDRIMKALRQGRGDMYTGGPMAWLAMTAQIFPVRLYDAIASRVDRDPGKPGDTGD